MMHFLLWLEQLRFSIWVRESDSIWAFPMFLFMHTLGMSMIAGVSAVVDIAIFGFWPRIPLKPLERLYPVMWTGFWINAVTGTVLMVVDASTKLTNPVFYIKMCFVFAGVALLVLMRKRIFHAPELIEGRLPHNAKLLAWASLICWLGAITAGRLLAYLGPVSGLSGISNH
jgi:hypothetical protein